MSGVQTASVQSGRREQSEAATAVIVADSEMSELKGEIQRWTETRDAAQRVIDQEGTTRDDAVQKLSKLAKRKDAALLKKDREGHRLICIEEDELEFQRTSATGIINAQVANRDKAIEQLTHFENLLAAAAGRLELARLLDELRAEVEAAERDLAALHSRTRRIGNLARRIPGLRRFGATGESTTLLHRANDALIKFSQSAFTP